MQVTSTEMAMLSINSPLRQCEHPSLRVASARAFHTSLFSHWHAANNKEAPSRLERGGSVEPPHRFVAIPASSRVEVSPLVQMTSQSEYSMTRVHRRPNNERKIQTMKNQNILRNRFISVCVLFALTQSLTAGTRAAVLYSSERP